MMLVVAAAAMATPNGRLFFQIKTFPIPTAGPVPVTQEHTECGLAIWDSVDGLEDVVPGEVGQTEKGKSHVVSLAGESERTKYTNKQNRNRFTDTRHKLMQPDGRASWEGGQKKRKGLRCTMPVIKIKMHNYKLFKK